MCSLILKPIPCLQNESISLTSIVKFILKLTHTSQKIMFHLLCFKWGRGGGYTTPSTPPSKVLYFLAMSNHSHLILDVTGVCLLLMWLISNTLKNFYISKLNPILNIPQIIWKNYLASSRKFFLPTLLQLLLHFYEYQHKCLSPLKLCNLYYILKSN